MEPLKWDESELELAAAVVVLEAVAALLAAAIGALVVVIAVAVGVAGNSQQKMKRVVDLRLLDLRSPSRASEKSTMKHSLQD